MHNYTFILFEIVKVMIAIALIHLRFGDDSPLSFLNNKILLFFFTTAAL